MNIDEIMKRFALLAELSDEDAEQWKPLCGDALTQILTQCRDDVDPAEQSGVLCAAVSALAYYQSMLCIGGRELGDFTAGEIKVAHRTHAVDYAKELWLTARERITPLLRDEGFYFGTIGGKRHEAQ